MRLPYVEQRTPYVYFECIWGCGIQVGLQIRIVYYIQILPLT